MVLSVESGMWPAAPGHQRPGESLPGIVQEQYHAEFQAHRIV